jgi:putative ABC transport system substrate-binding protein
MRRREFLYFFACAGGAVSFSAHSQDRGPLRLIGILLPATEDELEFQPRVAAFQETLQRLGWFAGRNIKFDVRWATANPDGIRKQARELVAARPDVVLAFGASTVGPILQVSGSIPIVFPVAADPVGAGFVDTLARPGRNATGFMTFEYSMGAKWLELLKQIAPNLTRVAVARDTTSPTGLGQFGVIQAVAAALRVDIVPINMRDAAEIERGLGAFARRQNGGLIVTASALASVHRALILKLTLQYKLPAIYFERSFVTAGGLICYGPDFVEQFRRSAEYVDRILKGEKAADLPVQAPTKYETVINLKTAKMIGLAVPPTLLARADEVIE